jgi:hypothetical protein
VRSDKGVRQNMSGGGLNPGIETIQYPIVLLLISTKSLSSGAQKASVGNPNRYLNTPLLLKEPRENTAQLQHNLLKRMKYLRYLQEYELLLLFLEE